MTRRAFMLMMEPTPYIAGLVRNLHLQWRAGMDVAFVGRNITQIWNECDDNYHVLPPNLLGAIRHLCRVVTRGRYGVVYLTGWGHPLLFVALLICWVRGIPTTIGSDTPLRRERLGWRRAMKAAIYPLLFKLPTVFLPGGTRQAAYVRSFGVSTDRIQVSQMTVDVEKITSYRDNMSREERSRQRGLLGLREDQVVFLFVGRHEPVKGLLVLLEAFASLDAQMAARVALVVVGDGSLRGLVDEAARERPNVVVTGRLAGNALLNVLCASDVFVLPSLSDGWGLVVNEAMAAGLPVIATNAVGCVDDLVEEGKTGIVVRSGDPQALKGAMSSLTVSSGMRKCMSEGALRRIRPWTLQNQASRIVAAWEGVCRD